MKARCISYFKLVMTQNAKCKIGKSEDPDNRVPQLQTGNPNKLYVYHTVNGYTKKEAGLYKKFADKRIPNSEWFYLSKTDVNNFIQETSVNSEPRIYNTYQASILFNPVLIDSNDPKHDVQLHLNSLIHDLPDIIDNIPKDTLDNVTTTTAEYTSNMANTCAFCRKVFSRPDNCKAHLSRCPTVKSLEKNRMLELVKDMLINQNCLLNEVEELKNKLSQIKSQRINQINIGFEPVVRNLSIDE